MKIIYFSPKAHRPIIRSLFRGHEFTGCDNVEDLIKNLCEPFDYCFFDLDVLIAENLRIFENIQSIFMDYKILRLNYKGRSSEVLYENNYILIIHFLKIINSLDVKDRRRNLRLKCRVPIEILHFDNNENHQCYSSNISVNGLFITGVGELKKNIDLIINKKYTAKAKLCWTKNAGKENVGYGLELKLDDIEDFKKFIKKELLPLSLKESLDIII